MKRSTLHIAFERLIGTAIVDQGMERALLQEPRTTALRFGLSPEEAALVADIRAPDLKSFSAVLWSRLYSAPSSGPGTRTRTRVIGK